LAWQAPGAPFEVQTGALGDRSVYRFLLAGATLTPIVGATTTLRLSPYLNHNANQNYFSDNQDYHDATRAGATAELALFGGHGHRVILGVDGAGTHVSSNFLGTPNIVDAAVFAQDEARLTGPVTATLGARLDYHDTDAGGSERTLNPKVALVWRHSDRLSLRASLARGYRAPSAIEQFVATTQFGFRVVPNPDLRGEHAWSEEVGVAARPADRVRVEGTVFQSDYRDLIGPAAAPGQFFVFQFRNVSRARVRGLDLAVRSSLVPDRLGVEASYLFLDDRDLDTHRPLPYRSRHTVTGTAELLRGLAAVDLRWRSRVEEVLAYPLDPRGDITVVDLRLAYRVRGMVVQAKVGNLFQRVYPDVQERVPGAPRSLSLALYGVF
jgi:outer membrane receptor protein involved in Fe transport